MRIRHIGPKADIWPDAPGAVPEYTVLQRTDMVARPLSTANVPASPDFVSGTYNLRLDDAGDATVVFPNTTSSDGVLWRERFSVADHLQFLEFYFNGELDFVGVIDQVTIDESSVTLHCDDAFWLLKKAYVRDWIVTQAPRDVIERATQVWTAVVADNFPPGSLNAQWGYTPQNGGTATIGPNGGLILSTTTTAGSVATIGASTTVTATGTWAVIASLNTFNIPNSGLVPGVGLFLEVLENSPQEFQLFLSEPSTSLVANANATVNGAVTTVAQAVTVPVVPSYTLQLESDGTWLFAFVNGQLITCVRRYLATATSLTVVVGMIGSTSSAMKAELTGVLFKSLQPFEM